MLTTHSRHVVDALSGSAGLLWVRQGSVDVASPDDEIGILLDIGALDVKERAGHPSNTAIVLTEDELKRALEDVLSSSGFDMGNTVVLPYYGVTTIKNLRPLVKIIQSTNPKAKLVLHRDRDFLRDDEVEAWKKEVRACGVEPYVTLGRDMEAVFIDPKYLAEVNPGYPESEFVTMIQDVLKEQKDQLIQDYVNGRVEIARRSGTVGTLNLGQLAVEAKNAVSANPARYAGKVTLRRLRERFQTSHKANLKAQGISQLLKDTFLAGVASKVPKAKSH